jgi:hypothetical protein
MVANPLPENCDVRFLNAPPIVGQLVFDQLGMIHVDYDGAEMPRDAVMAGVRARTCRLGGNVVSLLNNMNLGDHGLVQFDVYRMPETGVRGARPRRHRRRRRGTRRRCRAPLSLKPA